MSLPTYEARIMLAIEAIQSASKISVQKASAVYNIPKLSVCYRMKGNLLRTEK